MSSSCKNNLTLHGDLLPSVDQLPGVTESRPTSLAHRSHFSHLKVSVRFPVFSSPVPSTSFCGTGKGDTWRHQHLAVICWSYGPSTAMVIWGEGWRLVGGSQMGELGVQTSKLPDCNFTHTHLVLQGISASRSCIQWPHFTDSETAPLRGDLVADRGRAELDLLSSKSKESAFNVNWARESVSNK